MDHVSLEQVFSQTVNTGIEYHVFLTPDGDCKGLYVSAKSSGGFDVHELGGGTSSIAFEYRIMAKRIGYENARLVDVTDRVKQIGEHHVTIKETSRRAHPKPALPPIPATPKVPQLPRLSHLQEPIPATAK